MTDVLDGPWPDRVRSVLRTLAKDDAAVASIAAAASVLLHGSTTRGVDDAFSDLDVWMLPPTECPWRFIEFAVAGKPGQVQVESRRDFEVRIRRCDFPLIWELRHAVLLEDHDGWGDGVIALARREMSADVRAAWFAYHYIEMRSEHRSCDNPIDRGDAAALLLALTPALSHALRAAMVLDGQPYPYTKWLSASAASTPTGRQIVTLVGDVIDLIGDGALRQDGPERQHPLNIKLREIRQQLITAARTSGLDGPWLTEWYLHLDVRDDIHDVAWEAA